MKNAKCIMKAFAFFIGNGQRKFYLRTPAEVKLQKQSFLISNSKRNPQALLAEFCQK
jgi:hypothetical protein